jgi:hypothetical protein
MNYIIGPGSPNDKASIPLATSCGTYIPNERRLEADPSTLRAMLDFQKKYHPSARLRSLTQVYNCMGLVFASRRTCIDLDYLKMILKDDNYVKVVDGMDAKVGDIVIYRDNYELKHLGIIINVNLDLPKATHEFEVLSQWGSHGEYLHSLKDVPKSYGTDVEVWTERRSPK